MNQDPVSGTRCPEVIVLDKSPQDVPECGKKDPQDEKKRNQKADRAVSAKSVLDGVRNGADGSKDAAGQYQNRKQADGKNSMGTDICKAGMDVIRIRSGRA